jgi:hypothetical protein
MPEEWCMDAPFTDLRMAFRELAPSRLLDPGMRRDDGVFFKLKGDTHSFHKLKGYTHSFH